MEGGREEGGREGPEGLGGGGESERASGRERKRGRDASREKERAHLHNGILVLSS
jgi:hypothetical protein